MALLVRMTGRKPGLRDAWYSEIMRVRCWALDEAVEWLNQENVGMIYDLEADN